MDKDKVASLENIVALLSWHYSDMQLYQLYQYKEKKFGIIKETMAEEFILQMWEDMNYESALNAVNDELKENGIDPNNIKDEDKRKLMEKYLQQLRS